MKDICVLTYSGGLDTSVCIRLIQEKYNMDVVTVTVDVGQPANDIKEAEERAEKIGVSDHYTIDAKDEFAEDYIFRAIKANAIYEGYPLSTALARPLIATKAVEKARELNAKAIAHGCTGKGNDQFRFETLIRGTSDFEVIAPIRELNMSRKEEIEYAKEKRIPIPVTHEKPYSIDENLWGRSIEGGVLEDPSLDPPEDIFEMTVSVKDAPEDGEVIEIDFEEGEPVSLDNNKMPPLELIMNLNKIAGSHGVGRIDIIEDRILGLKSREIYEAPAAMTLLNSHKSLESLVLTRNEIRFKEYVDSLYGELIYHGLWHDPLRLGLDEYIDFTQKRCSGTVKIKLHKGNARVVSKESPFALYEKEAVSFDEKAFDQREISGMLKFHGFQANLFNKIRRKSRGDK
ncbi:MAG: argininosuccinate synthase [Candidatus Hydrothermarchaeota archaeon]